LREAGLFASEIRALPAEKTVVDEVQRLPWLLNEIHRAIETRKTRFVLCGSSARKLRTGGTNLLAGRALYRTMHPFVPEEIPEFDLSRSLAIGTLPVIMGSASPTEALEACVHAYLKQEIQAEALVRNLPGFARFLPVAALFHGQTLNVAGLARDAGVSRSTIQGYLEILEDTLLSFRLPAFEGRLRARERRHPKLYFTDPGLVRELKRSRGGIAPEELGHLFEGLVAQVLRAYRDYRDLFDDWFYWASGSARATEVDFLLHKGSRRAAIEVKAGTGVPDGAALKGLRALAASLSIDRRILVYRGDRRLLTEDGIEVLPAEVFFKELAAGSLFGG